MKEQPERKMIFPIYCFSEEYCKCKQNNPQCTRKIGMHLIETVPRVKALHYSNLRNRGKKKSPLKSHLVAIAVVSDPIY